MTIDNMDYTVTHNGCVKIFSKTVNNTESVIFKYSERICYS